MTDRPHGANAEPRPGDPNIPGGLNPADASQPLPIQINYEQELRDIKDYLASRRQASAAIDPTFNPSIVSEEVGTLQEDHPLTAESMIETTEAAFGSVLRTHHNERLLALYYEAETPTDTLIDAFVDGRIGVEQIKDVLRKKEALTRLRGYVDRKTFAENTEDIPWVFNHAKRKAAKYGKTVHVLFLDLTGFKSINDDPDLGHEKGDEMLTKVGEFLTLAGRLELPGEFTGDEEEVLSDPSNSFQVIRIGGDEFVVVEVGDEDPELTKHKTLMEKTPERMREICSEIGISYEKYPIAFHAGATTLDLDENYLEALKRADRNMNENKGKYYEVNPDLDRRKNR